MKPFWRRGGSQFNVSRGWFQEGRLCRKSKSPSSSNLLGREKARCVGVLDLHQLGVGLGRGKEWGGGGVRVRGMRYRRVHPTTITTKTHFYSFRRGMCQVSYYWYELFNAFKPVCRSIHFFSHSYSYISKGRFPLLPVATGTIPRNNIPRNIPRTFAITQQS